MNKLSLKVAQRYATIQNGRCLSDKYINIKEKLIWECSKKHIWNTSLDNIKNGRWCPTCAIVIRADNRKPKNGLVVARKIAKNFGGRCLSSKYINIKEKLLWECKNKHRWMSSLDTVKHNKSWCPNCAKTTSSKKQRNKNGLVIAKTLAQSKLGQCLSKEYVNNNTNMFWKCKKKHIWQATLNNVKNKHSWCPICAQDIRTESCNNSYILYHWKTGEKLICKASYEKRVVEYLNTNKINFKWQPRFFSMPTGRKYYPDMYLYSMKKWIEIKGYMRPLAKEKWEWFQSIKKNSELWDRAKLIEMGIM